MSQKKPPINLFSACGDDANGFKGLAFFAENFLKIKKPDGTTVKMPDRDVQHLKFIEQMSKTHIMKTIKLRGGGTKIIWVMK